MAAVIARVFVVAALVLAGVAPAHAATRHVPGDVATIGDALSLSSSGDTVLVAPGTYAGPIALASGVTLAGTGPADQVVLDGGGTGCAVIASATGSGTRLAGFRLVGGAGIDDGGVRVGGALRVSSGTVEVVDCRFETSSAAFGGGTAASYATITFRNCTWSGTSAQYGGGHFQAGGTLVLDNATFDGTGATDGGGLFATAGARVTVLGASFLATVALADGGGAHLDACVATLSDAVFDRARAFGQGGGLAVRGGGQVLGSFLVFVDNESALGGGAIHVSCSADPQSRQNSAIVTGDCALLSLTHCDIIRAAGAPPAAGAVTDAAVLRIARSIVAGNASGLACLDSRATLDVTCSDLYRNGGADLGGTCLPAADPSNVSFDPRFCSLSGRDFGLCANSEVADVAACGGYLGAAGVTCADCDATPARPATWGALKARYR